jgi:hypothetical protein
VLNRGDTVTTGHDLSPASIPWVTRVHRRAIDTDGWAQPGADAGTDLGSDGSAHGSPNGITDPHAGADHGVDRTSGRLDQPVQ